MIAHAPTRAMSARQAAALFEYVIEARVRALVDLRGLRQLETVIALELATLGTGHVPSDAERAEAGQVARELLATAVRRVVRRRSGKRTGWRARARDRPAR